MHDPVIFESHTSVPIVLSCTSLRFLNRSCLYRIFAYQYDDPLDHCARPYPASPQISVQYKRFGSILARNGSNLESSAADDPQDCSLVLRRDGLSAAASHLVFFNQVGEFGGEGLNSASI